MYMKTNLGSVWTRLKQDVYVNPTDKEMKHSKDIDTPGYSEHETTSR